MPTVSAETKFNVKMLKVTTNWSLFVFPYIWRKKIFIAPAPPPSLNHLRTNLSELNTNLKINLILRFIQLKWKFNFRICCEIFRMKLYLKFRRKIRKIYALIGSIYWTGTYQVHYKEENLQQCASLTRICLISWPKIVHFNDSSKKRS